MTSTTRRNFLKHGAAALAAGAAGSRLAGCPSSQAAEGSGRKGETLRFVHVTDTHLDLGKPQTVEWVEMLVDKINRDFSTAQFVLFGGDNFNNNVPGKDDALRFKRIADRLRMPWYSVRGNKESCPKPEDDALGQRDYAEMFFPSDLKVLGRDWKLEQGPYTILGIDTTLRQKDNGVFTPQSLSFVENELKSHPQRRYVLLNHQTYGNFWGGTAVADIHKYVLGNVEEVKRRLFGYPNLRLTLSGHKHLDHVDRSGSVKVIATLGFVVPQDPNNLDDHRFRYVELRDGTMTETLASIA